MTWARMFFLGLFACGCSASTVKTESLPNALPVSPEPGAELSAMAFFAHPMLRDLDLSPDGNWIAGVASSATKEVLMVRRRTGGRLIPVAYVQRARKTTAMTIESVAWAGDERVLFIVGEPLQGFLHHARRSRIFSVDVEGDVVELLARWPNAPVYFQSNVISLLPNDPHHFLLGVTRPGADFPAVYQVDTRTGRTRTVQVARAGIVDWYADHLGQIRAAWGVAKPPHGELGFALLARSDATKPLRPIASWTLSKGTSAEIAAFTTVPELAYVVTPKDSDRLGVYLFDLDKQEFRDERYVHEVVDVSLVVSSPFDGRPLYVLYEYERPEIEVLDASRKRIQEHIDRALAGRFNYVFDADRDESVFLVQSSSDVQPPEYYWYERQELVLFFKAYPELDGQRFSKMRPIRYEARDGLMIRGYLTRPVDAPDGPCATIVMPHGGPFARDSWGWNPIVQFLASRGFAVFQPNFRGSDGYGVDFQRAGWGEWGLAMQDDITDGVRWLIEEGEADPERIGIFGASYGGYAALQGLVSTPELYKAGASLSGVTDLRQFMSDVGDMLQYTDYMEKLVGDRRNDKDRLIATSPLHNARRIEAPVLLGHGTRDRNVSVSHTKEMARALRRADVPVELYIYDDEPHTFLDDRNTAHFFERLAEFFEEHLRPGSTRPPTPSPSMLERN